MRRLLRLLLSITLAFAATGAALAVVSPGSVTAAPIASLGQPSIRLYGPWKFHLGDSPVVHGKPLWADPAFDDSSWESVDLTPQPNAADSLTGNQEYVPGWQARGHPGSSGYGWYRLSIHVPPAVAGQLALEGPENVDDAYQLYDNGALIGHFGDFSRAIPTTYYIQPRMFRLPGNTAHLLAFRTYESAAVFDSQSDTGGLHNAPLLGTVGALALFDSHARLQEVRLLAPAFLLVPLFLLLALVAVAMFLSNPADRSPFWLVLIFLLLAASSALLGVVDFTSLFSISQHLVLHSVLSGCITAGWAIMWWRWFALDRPRWAPWAIAAAGALLIASSMVWYRVVPGLQGTATVRAAQVLSLALDALFLAFYAATAWLGLRRHRTEGLLALPALLFVGLAGAGRDHSLIPSYIWVAYGFQFSLQQIANLALSLSVLVLLFLRFRRSILHQKEVALDLKQAQEVQSVLLVDRSDLPWLAVDTAYVPAREVGGDFFQVVPSSSGDSVLVVVGDVAGKGLQAGILVALIVGALRTAAEQSADPEYLLAALNRALLGRGSCATCMALRLHSSGNVVLANAGHLAPVLQGREVAVAGSLPLGMLAEAEFSSATFHLPAGKQLLMVCDGVLEAQRPDGELFGFDRVLTLGAAGLSAGQVAETARAFGQQDDISVVTITRRLPLSTTPP